MIPKTALAVVIFNRPDLIPGLFSRIRTYAPSRLYLIADGPRQSRANESALCAATREQARSEIDWACRVQEIFSSENLGCRRRIVTGLDQVFGQEEEAIILEDDTWPEADFFPYCEVMLARFRQDPGVFSITGTNLLPLAPVTSYAFYSRFTHIWGWATWRRSWLLYDRDLTCAGTPELEQTLAKQLGHGSRYRYWTNLIRRLKVGEIDTWDYQLQVSAWLQSAACVVPPRNLVSNVGFRSDASHTTKDSAFANLPTRPLRLPLLAKQRRCPIYEWTFNWVFHGPPFLIRCVLKIAVFLRGRRWQS